MLNIKNNLLSLTFVLTSLFFSISEANSMENNTFTTYTFNINKSNLANSNLDEVRLVVENRLKALEIENYTINFKDNNIIISLPNKEKAYETDELKNLLLNNLNFKLKEPILDLKTGRMIYKNNSFLWKYIPITEKNIISVKTSPHLTETNVQRVLILLEEKERFKEITKRLLNKELALAINNEILITPIVNEVIEKGEIELTFEKNSPILKKIELLVSNRNVSLLKFKEKINENNKEIWKDLEVNVLKLRFKIEEECNLSIQLDEIGTKTLKNITTLLINKPLGIELNNKLISSPYVNESINTGKMSFIIQKEIGKEIEIKTKYKLPYKK